MARAKRARRYVCLDCGHGWYRRERHAVSRFGGLGYEVRDHRCPQCASERLVVGEPEVEEQIEL